MAIVAVVAAGTVGGYRAWDKATHTRDDNGGVLAGGGSGGTVPSDQKVPGKGQVFVTGSVTSANIQGAILAPLATPFTVTPLSRGSGGATFTPVVVNGNTTSIDWQTGQPLPLSGDGGSLQLSPVTCTVADGAIAVVLDGVHVVTPGTYTIDTSVAVGPQPRDSVTFTAGDTTTVEFRGGATTPLPTADLKTRGTGTVTLEGALTVARSDKSRTPLPSITLDNGAFEITLTPTGNGDFTLTAILQGTTS
jgi:hypothetical protein